MTTLINISIHRIIYKNILLVLSIAIIIVSGTNLSAQTNEDCDSILVLAEGQYRLGYWNNAINLIQQCLQKQDISNIGKEKAYRLLGLIYIATELEKEAKEAIKNLLILAPNYQINSDEDPPQFQKLIQGISNSLIPEIDIINPNKLPLNEIGVKLKVNGSNFSYGSKVQFDGNERSTDYINSGELIAYLTEEDLMKGGKHSIGVYSPIMGGKVSNIVDFIVDTVSISTNLKILLNATFALPIADFADDKGNEGDGFATMGFGAIADIHFPVGTPGLGWFSSLGFIYNGYDDDVLIKTYGELGFGAKNNIVGYMTIPVMTGLSYLGNISTNLSYLIHGQVALSIINGPDITSKLTNNQYSGTVEISYDMSTSFGFGAGAGLIVNDFFILSFRYLNFVKAARDFTVNVTLRDNYTGETASARENGSEDISASVVMISIGVMF